MLAVGKALSGGTYSRAPAGVAGTRALVFPTEEGHGPDGWRLLLQLGGLRGSVRLALTRGTGPWQPALHRPLSGPAALCAPPPSAAARSRILRLASSPRTAAALAHQVPPAPGFAEKGRIRPRVSEEHCCCFLHAPALPRTAVPPPLRRLFPQPCPKPRVSACELCLGGTPAGQVESPTGGPPWSAARTATGDVRVAMEAALGKEAGAGFLGCQN